MHDLVKVAGNNENNDDRNVLDLRILTRDAGVGDERHEYRGHDTHSNNNNNNNESNNDEKQTSKDSDFTTIVSVLYASSSDNTK